MEPILVLISKAYVQCGTSYFIWLAGVFFPQRVFERTKYVREKTKMNVPGVVLLPQAKAWHQHVSGDHREHTEAPERKPSQASPVQSQLHEPKPGMPVHQAKVKLAPVGRENLQITSVLSARAISYRRMLEAKTCVHVNAEVRSKSSNK